jgi:hypothetical protein
MNKKYVFQCIDEKKTEQPSLANFAISCSHTRTILHTARKKMSTNPPQAFYTKKIIKCSTQYLPSFSCLCPRTAQKSNPATLSNTRYLCDYKPLLTVEPAEPAAQGIILIKTANAVITFFSSPYIMEKKIGFFGKIETFESNTRIWKENVNGMLLLTTRGLAQAGHYLVGKYLCNNKLCGSWQVCGSPACAKPQNVVRYGGTEPA